MAVLKLYPAEQIAELLHDSADDTNPIDFWNFNGNTGLSTDRTLFLLLRGSKGSYWRSIRMSYDMVHDKFYINKSRSASNLIELDNDEEILKYFVVDTPEIIDFEN
jgi:hypothetical protein